MLCEKLHLINNQQNIENQNYFGLNANNSIKKDLINNSDGFISNPNLIFKTSSLLVILEIIFTNNKIIAIEQLKSIIPFLSCEFSPCIQKSFLLIFLKIFSSEYLINSYNFSKSNLTNSYNSNQNITGNYMLPIQNSSLEEKYNNLNNANFYFNNYDDFNNFQKDPAYFIDDTIRTKYISVFLKNKGLEHILAISSISTLDVRIECIKIFDIFSRLSCILPYNMEEQLIPFIANCIFPLNTPINDYNGINNINNFNSNNILENFENNFGSNSNIHNRNKSNNNITINKNFKNLYSKDDSKINFKTSISEILEIDSLGSLKEGKKSLSDLENEDDIKRDCFKKDISAITPIQKFRNSPNLKANSKLDPIKMSQNLKNEFDVYESNFSKDLKFIIIKILYFLYHSEN